MGKNQIVFRRLRIYKYQIMDDYKFNIDLKPEKEINSPFISIFQNGELVLKKKYAWDGPSGPTIDTINFMRGSLVHDAFYQLIREGHLDMSYRNYADRLLQKMCSEDGMSRIRAWYVYWAVHLFGKSAAKPATGKESKLIYAP